MNADDRKMLKKLIDRDVTRGLATLDRRESAEVDNCKKDVPIELLPDEAKGLVSAIQASINEIGRKMDQLSRQGFKLEDGALSFRGYDPRVGYVTRTPTIHALEITSAEIATRERAVRASFRPQREKIEEAQAAALINVVSQDLPGVREELEKLRSTIFSIVGAVEE